MTTSITPTHAELLYLSRMRKRLTVAEMARRRKVDLFTYQQMEQGKIDCPFREPITPLKPHEICRIMRRREGLRQVDVAKAMKCTRLWVHKMESGKAPIVWLANFWGIQ
jgi:hypothetical protein